MRNNQTGVCMSLNKHLAGAVIAAAVLVISAGADAKGPQWQGAGSGAMPSHSASSGSQGIGSNTWPQPPGWSKADDSKGWDSGIGSTPPGWDNNSVGQEPGWGADATTTPGLAKH
jgi:hypothetical protein